MPTGGLLGGGKAGGVAFRYPRRMRIPLPAFVASLLVLSAGAALAKETREEKVAKDRVRVESDGFWIYDDLAQGQEEAKRTGKPLVVALRCVPCEECVKLDDDLVDKDPRVRPLLEKFVRVRLITTNGLDLSTFQFDTDQSFAVFLLRADGTIYGRYGTRSDRTEWADDVSVEGLSKALEGALALHEGPPEARVALAKKRGPAPLFPTPERFPSLKVKYTSKLGEGSKLVPSCIHCHMIGEAERTHLLEKSGKLPDEVLLPYPHPKAIGLVLDPKERARVLRVEKDTPAAAAGFRPGDIVRELEGQPLLSIADVQWVLHHTPAKGGSLTAVVLRGTETKTLTLRLEDGWRRQDDIGWRASTWGLRRLALGGMKLSPLAEDDPLTSKLPKKAIALRIAHVGQYAPHDVAKRAGFKVGDVLVSFDGKTDLPRETDVLLHVLGRRRPAKDMAVKLLRGKEELTVTLPAPSK